MKTTVITWSLETDNIFKHPFPGGLEVMELLVCFGKTPRLWIFSNLPVVAAYTRSALEKRHLLKIPTTGIPYSLRSSEVFIGNMKKFWDVNTDL